MPNPYYKDIRLGHLDQSHDEYDFLNGYFDDIYIADSRARVEVGDNADFLSCTKRDIQIATFWTDGSISFDLRTPSFTGGETRYVFVVNADGAWTSRELSN